VTVKFRGVPTSFEAVEKIYAEPTTSAVQITAGGTLSSSTKYSRLSWCNISSLMI